MFAGVCEIDVTRTLWDHYFMERDPFFFFFLTLVVIINAKYVKTENGLLCTLPSLFWGRACISGHPG